jgi:hypothetical protein
MSIKIFIRRPEVGPLLKALLPTFPRPRKISVPLRVEPRTKHYALVGTAFDYLLRFELQRRAPHAKTRKWAAEYALKIIYHEDGRGGVFLDLLRNDDPNLYMSPEEVAERIRDILQQAKAAVNAYVINKSPTRSHQEQMALHAIHLAHLEQVYRRMYLDPNFQQVDGKDVQDLLELLAVVPFDSLIDRQTLILNPDFGASSKAVSGTDEDLITGDCLVNFKTTKSGEIKTVYLTSLASFLVLARHERLTDPAFPVINRLGIYFCRHAYFWTMDVGCLIENPHFKSLEKLFFDFAQGKQHA